MYIKELIELVNPLHVSRTKPEENLHSIVQNSRQVTKNSVFIAIKGHEVDGHMFLEDAISRGAKVLITEESYYTDAKDVCVMEVENTRILLGKLAHAFAGNPAKKLKIIGITGTNGKTTTATLVHQVLSSLGEKVSLLGTVSKKILEEELDSALTTSDPIELANDMKKMIEAGSEYLVMEVSSHALVQSRVSGFDFKVAVFTNLSHDHLDYHVTIEEYAKAKKILFDELPSSSTAIINADDQYGAFMLANCTAKKSLLSFGTDQNYIQSNTSSGLTLMVNGALITSPLIGEFNAYNVAQTFLICKALGLKTDSIAKALKNAAGAAGRMEKIELDAAPLAIVDYAHTPDALKNVLSTLHKVKEPSQKLIVVFGAGGDRDTSKRPEMAKAAEEYADKIFVTSDNPRFENPEKIIEDILKGFDTKNNVTSITNRKEAIRKAIGVANKNDIVLIAGKGHEDYQDVEGTKHPFDDRLIARDALELYVKGGI
ncbi:MAG: UDP-N-acetylmuramoyl-L-alanyl-D-glutamate--2,6-diaminopimelate ligase [Balneolaceae bacterium]|nr:UDP-N-acetylmuramoyl-L-alanyl-D-glutamate--2,6-diaminopimelate ligase [Balneolaceae bacterium]MBO6545005.1 UDP-N-acetylmuramoyl-L-alanyl-D-glutamate--2,6-diaminopimelate ligase [Balneolaceae bacterium]MBO6646401.1 UDP-N-acetylmuramoyl-L-alanyl-D-glutamate--2,6-diaminopimelate ligase [Balneolaceae bacterium]